MTMRLQHFTTPENAILIAFAGLTPHIHKAGTDDEAWTRMQTMGVPVVWLTKEESNIATVEYVEHWLKRGVKSDINIGEPSYGGPVGCTTEVKRTRPLMGGSEFLRTTKIEGINPDDPNVRVTGRDVLHAYETSSGCWPAAFNQWWVSTRAIPASRVWVPLTRAQGIEGCERHMTTHIDPEARERFAQQRNRFAALDAKTLIVLHDGKGQLLERKAA